MTTKAERSLEEPALCRFRGQAVRQTPVDQPDQSIYLANLGLALTQFFRVTEEEEVLDDALACFLAAAEVTAAPPRRRLIAAREGARLAISSGHHREAAAAFTEAIQLTLLASWHGLGRASQEWHMIDSQGLAAEAGAAFLHLGRVQEAVRQLELGRAVMWGQMLQRRTDLSGLYRQAPALATRLAEIRAELDQWPTSPGLPRSHQG